MFDHDDDFMLEINILYYLCLSQRIEFCSPCRIREIERVVNILKMSVFQVNPRS